MRQEQFLDLVDEQTAHERLRALADKVQLGTEVVPLPQLLGRVLAEDVRAPVDVPGFDRSNVDGFAIRAQDSIGADELHPVTLKVSKPGIAAGDNPEGREVGAGEAISVATGAIIPRGADAMIMVEDTVLSDSGELVELRRAVAPGQAISWAGTDLGCAELVLFQGQRLSSRDTGLLAAVGLDHARVRKRPRVLVLSTGDEIKAPGQSLICGQIYDSNQRMVCDAAFEAGAEVVAGGILPDHEDTLRAALEQALEQDFQVIVLSGGTSKGAGDLNARVVAQLARENPDSAGVVVHGVTLKPGKPLCLAELRGCLVVILPGFPTSAMFTFHEFIRPVLLSWGGLKSQDRSVEATVPMKIPSVAGRTQYSLVNLVPSAGGLAAYPLGSGSGSVTTFARADGFLRIDQHSQYLEPESSVKVRLLGPQIRPADLIVIGSHCLGLDALLSLLSRRGLRVKSMSVGSKAGLWAIERGEADLAGCHLYDAKNARYNEDFLPPGSRLIKAYKRRQGLVFRDGDGRFAELGDQLWSRLIEDASLRMVNRNAGSGTRVLIDEHLAGSRPPGYEVQARSHHAVAAAVKQGRADWGVTLEVVARQSQLAFVPIKDEDYDFALPSDRLEKPAVQAFLEVLSSKEGQSNLKSLGFLPESGVPKK